MRYTFEEEFRLDHPTGIGEIGMYFYLDSYKDWLEDQLIEARKRLALYNVAGQREQLKAFVDWWHSLSQEELVWYEGRYVEVFLSL